MSASWSSLDSSSLAHSCESHSLTSGISMKAVRWLTKQGTHSETCLGWRCRSLQEPGSTGMAPYFTVHLSQFIAFIPLYLIFWVSQPCFYCVVACVFTPLLFRSIHFVKHLWGPYRERRECYIKCPSLSLSLSLSLWSLNLYHAGANNNHQNSFNHWSFHFMFFILPCIQVIDKSNETN